MRSGFHVPVFICLSALVLIAACGGGADENAAPRAATTTNPVDAATAGSIAGTVRFEGTPPAAREVVMDTDPYCERQPPQTTATVLVGKDSGLQNVFVYVKDGLGDLAFPVPSTPVVLDQQGCRYVPHVFGIQVGQTLEIRSSDNTLHNVHAMAAVNREFNMAHQAAGVSHTHVFSATEVMLPFKCDVHKWMTAFAGVLDHPFFAVTTADGRFEITGLPPGTYTLEARHETLGTMTQSITVDERQTSDLAFTFTS